MLYLRVLLYSLQKFSGMALTGRYAAGRLKEASCGPSPGHVALTVTLPLFRRESRSGITRKEVIVLRGAVRMVPRLPRLGSFVHAVACLQQPLCLCISVVRHGTGTAGASLHTPIPYPLICRILQYWMGLWI